MDENPIQILLIEDNPQDRRLLEEVLGETQDGGVHLLHADTLARGLERLAHGDIDLVLLDLLLPDGRGLGVVDRLHVENPQTPVIVLSGVRDDEAALLAIQLGAQDYLVKDQMEGEDLLRAVRYAIERHRTWTRLLNLSVIDDLTGLHNRRGFLILARQQLAFAERTRRRAILLFVDLDELKQINDDLGHPEGDAVLVETARILRQTFRKSDIVGRMGGDEFAVLALETSDAGSDALLERLHAAIDEKNDARPAAYPIALSIGLVHIEPGAKTTVEELIAQADVRMYEQKRGKKKP